jgi:hypothetical protein
MRGSLLRSPAIVKRIKSVSSAIKTVIRSRNWSGYHVPVPGCYLKAAKALRHARNPDTERGGFFGPLLRLPSSIYRRAPQPLLKDKKEYGLHCLKDNSSAAVRAEVRHLPGRTEILTIRHDFYFHDRAA